MDEKNLYVLAIFDAETQKKLTALYDALHKQGFEGMQTKQIPYHFTLSAYDLTQQARLCAPVFRQRVGERLVGDHPPGVGQAFGVSGEVKDQGYNPGFLKGIRANMTAGT